MQQRLGRTRWSKPYWDQSDSRRCPVSRTTRKPASTRPAIKIDSELNNSTPSSLFLALHSAKLCRSISTFCTLYCPHESSRFPLFSFRLSRCRSSSLEAPTICIRAHFKCIDKSKMDSAPSERRLQARGMPSSLLPFSIVGSERVAVFLCQEAMLMAPVYLAMALAGETARSPFLQFHYRSVILQDECATAHALRDSY